MQEDLFPVYYDGHMYQENDCADLFLVFYNSKNSLSLNGGVYAYDDMYIYPDGTIVDTEEYRK